MRVLVCGGRNYDDTATVFSALSAIDGETEIAAIIEGGATGADQRAAEWARINEVDCELFVADWVHKGRKAGPLRNQRMLDEGKPDLVVAFPGGKGTADMVRRAEKAGVPVRRIT